MAILAPSILAADWGRMSEEIQTVAEAGADWIHIDVMDGHFVPPITIGPGMVAAIKRSCTLPLDVHLMVEAPENQLKAFRDAGADFITVHLETCPHVHRTVQSIKELGAKAGVAINPGTPVNLLESIISELDLLLIMTVNPGWGGQSFIANSAERISAARELIAQSGRRVHLEVDGGVNEKTAAVIAGAGADVLVAGSYIFGKDDYRKPLEALRKASEKQE